MTATFVTDFLVDQSPGGAERVDDTIIKHFNFKVVTSPYFEPVAGEFYILSNISLLPQHKIDYLAENCRYVIIEHDYKFHHTRHPWRFEGSLVPSNEIINRHLYKNAIVTFVQTEDHLNVFRLNNIEGNFESLNCSVWSKEELNVLSNLLRKTPKKNSKFAVLNSGNWIKNTRQAKEFCDNMKINYDLIGNKDYYSFLESLSNYSALVFFPIARETCCRLLVEAKCLGLNVITSDNSGAFKSDWFSRLGMEMIDYLENISIKNLKRIADVLNENTN
jgi:hypothetical protein